MSSEPYRCMVCGKESHSQWTIAKCELGHTWEKLKRSVGIGGDDE